MTTGDRVDVARDDGRAAVYAAELAAFDGTDLEQVVGVDAVRHAVRAVTGMPWWPGGEVTVRAGRSDAQSSSTRCDGDVSTIRIAAPQATIATAAHELAHALAGARHGHDDVYRQALLDVIAVMTNADSTDRRHDLHTLQLAASFRAARLSIGRREWPAPPAEASGAIAL